MVASVSEVLGVASATLDLRDVVEPLRLAPAGTRGGDGGEGVSATGVVPRGERGRSVWVI